MPLNMIMLSPEDLDALNSVVQKGPRRSRKVLLATALMWLDCASSGPAMSMRDVSNSLGLPPAALEEMKGRYLLGGVEAAVNYRPPDGARGSGRTAKIDNGFEAKLLDLAQSECPVGHNRWSVRLLAKRAVEDNLIAAISHMTVYRVLKKHNIPLPAKG
ncbi:MAG: helix-turn-helix domain-containing protein [Deltaproteobacteria bacterium]|jgi:hypothetical protein|nr:helix-turn-helix domain-containing protein [Deltaproteobacteria bacterium]